ncbi:hypothetical protein F610DRAFT_06000 [Streptomyces sp. LaPpAH-199]|uniref:hypothetical protein n=1 Tax=Streptomyces TaxID=1883 RepID=UPI000886E62F|nr:hypothetical protein [Streptomyces sp. LaPpAH-199]MYW76520.1 hypothetical protein [Streptomyces sp. SID8369]SDE05098.1 hypothetical protein F610DRAFT_06000 [Streptomyces sp. LaPpAH-199]
MLSHVIPPVRGYTKCSNSLVRHPRLCSDAKILVLYVQGLPACDRDKALSEHARSLLMTGRAYQRAKAELLAHGYVHERRERIAGGRWRTVQVMSNEPLTADQAARLYAGAPADGYAVVGAGRVGRTGHAGQVGHAGHAGRTASGAWSAPSARFPTVGEPTGRSVGGQLPADEDLGEDTSHPPTEAEAGEEAEGDAAASESVPGMASVPVPVPGLGAAQGSAAAAPSGSAEVLAAERVLLSLRHERRELLLGVREARTLAGLAAEWLRRGVSPGDLRAALTRGLPKDGVRSALGFLAHRLVEKLPAPPAEQPEPVPPSPPPSPLALIACAGPGEEHMFRPNVPWATTCGPCHREEQRAYWEDMRARTEAAPEPLPWRERFAAEGAEVGTGPDVGG